MSGGWTVGTMLCHLAFWDKMTVVRLQKWIETGRLVIMPDQDNIDSMNDSIRHLSRRISFEEGIQLVTESADEIDTFVGNLNPAQIGELESTGRERWFKRFFHRQAHLEKIEKALAAAPPISGFGLYRRGLLMHLTNPKALLGWIATMTLGLGPQQTLPYRNRGGC